MLAHLRLAVVAVAGLLVVAVAAVPAEGQVEPAPIDCQAVPTAAECSDKGSSPGEDDQSDNPARVCRFDGARVPCQTAYGFWIGDVVDGDWFGQGGDKWPALLVGCWAVVTSPDRDPPTSYHGQADSGSWYTLACLGPGGAWPVPGPVQFDLAWAAAAADAPDAEAVARQALASIDLRPPELVLSPPETGSVLLGMPLWLAVNETASAWGPITGEHCEDGLCVAIEAWAVRLDWQMGDGATLSCSRGQNRTWKPGMDFLTPGQACHHLYAEPSRGEQHGRYQVTASTTFHADWSGGGQSGTFTDVTDSCGPGGDGPCRASTTVRVDEIQVLVEQ